MSSWISEKAKAKINLSLHVLGRREDGYHSLDSRVAFADVGDELHIRPALKNSCVYSGPFAQQLPKFEDNILFKAWEVARDILVPHAIKLPFVEIKLEKNLPVASGIGGGSADAAAMLRALFKLVDFKISKTELSSLAHSLGADVPVCFLQKSCRMQGIGEDVSPCDLDLPKAILLVNPNKPCSTADVFKRLSLQKGQKYTCTLSDWHNDLTEAAMFVQPEIRTVLDILRAKFDLENARMSGSGATSFGLADSVQNVAEEIKSAHPTWWVKSAVLS